MISIDSSLCAGCGICVDTGSHKAISLVHDQVSIDAKRCDDCGLCVQACPNQALALVIEPEIVAMPLPTMQAAPRSSTDVVDVEPAQPAPWRLVVRPAVGAFLGWVGHELVPRFVPLALDTLGTVLDLQLSRVGKDVHVDSAAVAPGNRKRQRRHRHRHGRAQK